jgi:hypothetical protein
MSDMSSIVVSSAVPVVGDDGIEARRIASLIASDPAALEMVRAALAAPKTNTAKAAAKTTTVKPATVKKAAVPEGEGEDAPSAASYRIPADEIDTATCVGRVVKGGEDKRWTPAIYRESQCGKDVEDGGLCKACAEKAEKYAADPKYRAFQGRVTEEPFDWSHMLGTAWAEKAKPVFGAASSASSASSAASVVSTDDNDSTKEMSGEETKAKITPAKAAAKAAAAEKKAAKAAEKAAAAEKKAAEKAAAEAEKEAKKAAAAEKKAATAEKKAAAAEKKAAKAEKPKDAEKPKKEKAKATKEKAKAEGKATAEEPVSVGEIAVIDGVMYMVKKGNAYEIDEMSQEVRDYAGKATKVDGEWVLDGDAEEDVAPESGSE